VLAWILGEPPGDQVWELLGAARLVVTSDLTFAECRRALVRAASLGEITEEQSARLGAKVAAAAESWTRFPVDPPTLERASRPFPVEPIRTLDALHLASALLARDAVPDIALLSLDQRVRSNGEALGFTVLPSGPL
jgi:predicted nucleic acid-binding protein